MKTQRKVLACGLAALLGLVLSANGRAADDKNAGGDLKFVQMAASGGMFEVKSSQLALDQSNNPQVKKFAEHMVKDHTKANQELMALAKQKGIPLPAQMAPKHMGLMEKITAAKGAAFDQMFLKIQLQAHEDTVALFEQEAKNGQDPAIKAWAAKTLPTLREHLKEVRSLAGVGGKGSRER